MKYFIFTISILALFCSAIKAQIEQPASFDERTGYWRVSSDNKSQGTSPASIEYSWTSVTTPVNTNILGIIFVDSLYGWLSDNSNGSMRSTDGGATWTVTTFNDTNFSGGYNSVYFIDRNTGWCTGSAIQIRKTTNGGATWFKQYGPPVAGIAHSIYFFDANTGIIAGSKNYPYVPFIAKTTNGGTNWTELSDAFSGAQELNDQYWLNTTTGWISGYNVLLKTTDAGATFTNIFSNVPPTGNGANDLLCIYFVNQQTGWVGGSNLDKNNIYRTTNAGANWVFQPNPVSQNNAYVQINDMMFFSQDSGWAVHGTPFTGAIMFTSNGGTNWIVEQQAAGWYQCLAYYQRMKAWCGSDGGLVWSALMSQPLAINNYSSTIPKSYQLHQNFPNPFNPETKIRFDLPENVRRQTANMRLVIYDVLGKEVSTLINKQLESGSYEVTWNASNYNSGIYFYKLTAGSFTETKKMAVVK